MFVVLNHANGLHLRQATQAEISIYWGRQPDPRCRRGNHNWTRPVRLSETEVVDHYTHVSGEWYGGASF